MEKLTLEEKELLWSKDYDTKVTVKQDAQLRDKIDQRFSYCMLTLFEKFNVEHEWFDYSNERGEDAPGEFDKNRYSEEIGYVGDHRDSKTPGWADYDGCIPTAWLWTDFENDLDKFIAEQQKLAEKKAAQVKVTKEQKKQTKTALIESIQKKLSKEELSVVKFVK